MISAAKSGRRDSNQSGDGVVKKPEESAQEKLEKCAQWSKKMGMAMPSVPGKVVLDQSTIERLRHKGVVKTADEKLAATALYAANEERLKNESEARKLELKQQNMYRTKGPKLAQLDGDAHKTSHLLAKAFEMRQNREPEIQYCNSLILSTKCHAIRCAQLEEKERNHEGRESTEDDQRPGRPVTVSTPETVTKINQIVLADRRMSIRMIAEAINADKETVRKILHKELHMTKVSAKLVLKNLTPDQKFLRQQVCSDFLEKLKEDPGLMKNIITCHKTWIFQYDFETKRQSMHWKTPESPRIKKARMSK
ncbi:Hypothetical protein CINCED_3A003092 [Cinara cedri]|uniref:Winged helix-turn-helix DNA-binding domain n=1 Tax=Cinara cedri TaxID=506608 RepID=A0A5E4MBM1_9HEMI|nr:Hypothetical protein CINCED_3A003092 [Cinara cedri]